jgi:hypothetical protein
MAVVVAVAVAVVVVAVVMAEEADSEVGRRLEVPRLVSEWLVTAGHWLDGGAMAGWMVWRQQRGRGGYTVPCGH